MVPVWSAPQSSRVHVGSNLQCPNCTKLFESQPKVPTRFEPWNCWGLCWEIDVGPPLYAHYCGRRCRRMVPVWSTPQLSRVLVGSNLQCPNCIKLLESQPKVPTWFKPWNCQGLCWEIDVSPPLFTHYCKWTHRRMVPVWSTPQPSRVLASSNLQCPNSIKLLESRLKVPTQFEPWNCWGLCWEIDVSPPLFTHYCGRRCRQIVPVWWAPQPSRVPTCSILSYAQTALSCWSQNPKFPSSSKLVWNC